MKQWMVASCFLFCIAISNAQPAKSASGYVAAPTAADLLHMAEFFTDEAWMNDWAAKNNYYNMSTLGGAWEHKTFKSYDKDAVGSYKTENGLSFSLYEKKNKSPNSTLSFVTYVEPTYTKLFNDFKVNFGYEKAVGKDTTYTEYTTKGKYKEYILRTATGLATIYNKEVTFYQFKLVFPNMDFHPYSEYVPKK